MSNDLEFEIQIFIESYLKNTNNKSGLSITTIMSEFSIDFKDSKPILNNLHQNKKIITRKGLNSVLIFLPKTK